jgi:putative chitinase
MADLAPSIAAAIASLAPSADRNAWAAALAPSMQSSGVTSPKRMAMFLGQCAEETAGFAVWVEDLYYLTAERMCQVWPEQFPTQGVAAPYIGRPEALANHVYACRDGNGDEQSGDGWLFRGRGLIQLTGRSLYTDFGHAVGMEAEEAAAFCETMAGAARSACWYWCWAYHGHLNTLADEWDVTEVTRLINGGLINLSARVKACATALAVLAAGAFPEIEMSHNNAATPPKPVAPATVASDEADALNQAELRSLASE